MAKDYEKLLDRAMDQIPEAPHKKSRFEIPEVDIDVSGNRTTLKNLGSIASELGRDPNLLMKYLLKELGTAGNREGDNGMFQGKFTKGELQERIDSFTEEYVLCDECGRPDTELIKEGRVTMLKCDACGARSSVRSV
ncbi:translation initiation factor IF-2 subunit beta [candidate division MSBL1 archaeon SCGC-AAA259E17]|uniref:Translation initiation factor 2 subunit beta n=1 Tax=candidate division MSBL1 archaeon SCGC-AAA259E17 TaxID=1698263 RepID=A0A133UD66_9EURY|nr:translation initiation factor IF-2 subunit beta [candidate division MSBL1 archaeon SCGC-AAA259E17]